MKQLTDKEIDLIFADPSFSIFEEPKPTLVYRLKKWYVKIIGLKLLNFLL